MTKPAFRQLQSAAARPEISCRKEGRSKIDRREFGVLFAAFAGSSMGGWSIIKPRHVLAASREASTTSAAGNTVFEKVINRVLPPGGFQSRIALNESVLKLTEYGVIDPGKFRAIYRDRGNEAANQAKRIPNWSSEPAPELKEILIRGADRGSGLAPDLEHILRWPSPHPILLTRENANFYVNLLWPIGLANSMAANKESPLNGEPLSTFASTGGWTLGDRDDGGAYFNKFPVVALTPERERLVTRVAKSTFRPCCNNSTFFQDCNHGSALLGLLQLGASQGLAEQDLYREALRFNSFWFPAQYLQTALYLEVVEGLDWARVDPATVMGFNYSALGPWQENIADRIAKIPDLIPEHQGSADCGL